MKISLFIIAMLLSFGSFAQGGYDIKFTITGLKDTTAYLAYHFGESTLVMDTATVSAQGEFAFTNKKELREGLYFLAIGFTKAFEFVVSKNQHFNITTSTADYSSHLSSDEAENTLFFDHLKFNAEQLVLADPFIKVLKDSTASEKAKTEARESYRKIAITANQYQEDMLAQHPATVLGKILKANKPQTAPEPPKKANGQIDSTFQLRWYRQHFFDNIDLADDMYARLPNQFYKNAINEYLDKLYAQNPDSLWTGIQYIINKTKKNRETYKYAVWTCIVKYQQPEIMGLDELYMRLYDEYLATGEMDFWMSDKTKQDIKETADRIRPCTIGKTGANLIMQDVNLRPKALYDVKAKYTLLYIFSSSCGHCKTETPKLVEFYQLNKTKFDVDIYAVDADTAMAETKRFIKEMKMPWTTVSGPRSYQGSYRVLYDAETTPAIYILDNNKKIIAKKLKVEQLEQFFNDRRKQDLITKNNRL